METTEKDAEKMANSSKKLQASAPLSESPVTVLRQDDAAGVVDDRARRRAVSQTCTVPVDVQALLAE